MQQRLPSLLRRPITFAHRGASAHAPENTIEAFRLALRLGASGLESDVWLTRDGVAVLDHDGQFRNGVLKKRTIANLDRHDLPTHIPTLVELWDACGTDFDLSLDLKAAGTGEAVVGLAQIHAPSQLRRLWLCDPDLERLGELRRLDDRIRLVNSTKVSKMSEGPERRAARLASLDIDCVNMNYKDWNGGLVALFHRFGLNVFSWDLQQAEDLRTAFRMGVDAVYSDYVDRMVTEFELEC